MSTDQLTLALGQHVLPQLRERFQAQRQQAQQKQTLESVLNIYKDKSLDRAEKYEKLGTTFMPTNPQMGMKMLESADAVRTQKQQAINDLATKTLEQKISLAKGMYGKADAPNDFNLINKVTGLDTFIGEFPDGTAFETKSGKVTKGTAINPFNDGQLGISLINEETGSTIFAKAADGSYIVPASTTQKTQDIKTEEYYRESPKFKVATPEQVKNNNLEGRIFKPEGSNTPFIQIETLSGKQTDALTQIDKVSEGLADSLKVMKELDLSPDPITGRIPLIGDTINVLTKNPEWQTWQAQVDRLFQDFRKIVTGAQASDAEIQRLIPLMPTSRDKNPEVFTRKAIQVINEMNKTKSRLLNVYEGQGYDIGAFRNISSKSGNKQVFSNVDSIIEAAQTAKRNSGAGDLTRDEIEKIRAKFQGNI